MYSKRLPDDLSPNALARAREALGSVPLDLTGSNPTRCGIEYPAGLLTALGRDAGLAYRPEPLGLPLAREAVAADYRRRGVEVDPARVVLTASTSEAYGYLFKLLCDPGDEVLVPAPSYPLLRHLVALDGARPVPYRLDPHDAWQPDPHDLAAARARAIVSVHPNNPTGTHLARASADALLDACARTGAAWIVDEVFLDFPLAAGAAPGSFAGETRAPTFCLGGLSKQAGLPQLKLSWIVVGGPAAAASETLERLAFLADQYLSVSTPVQLALPELLAGAAIVRGAILTRCRRNLESLERAVAGAPAVTLVRPAGGWSAALRFPATISEERLALELLERDGVAVHPGHLFDFPGIGYLVLSLLPQPSLFDEAVTRVLERLRRVE